MHFGPKFTHFWTKLYLFLRWITSFWPIFSYFVQNRPICGKNKLIFYHFSLSFVEKMYLFLNKLYLFWPNFNYFWTNFTYFWTNFTFFDQNLLIFYQTWLIIEQNFPNVTKFLRLIYFFLTKLDLNQQWSKFVKMYKLTKIYLFYKTN
jgi:hypothetical protein